MARQLWPGTDPVGKRIRTGGFDARPDTPWMTVVGVVGRIKQDSLDTESRMALYRAQTQFPSRAMNVVLRTEGDPEALAAAVRREIGALDPDLPIYNLRTMSSRVSESLAPRRFSTMMLALFAALALGLAATGTYGVIAYLVTQGTREIGIRMALGASPRGIRRLVVRQGMLVAAIGLAAGIAGALVLTRFMQGLLFGIDPLDPVTFVSIPVILAGVAGVASYLPARRAARVDPLVSLRSE
jgi:ABC-type lipoprotein release transport system permease subunit